MDYLKSVCRVCLQHNLESNSFFDEVEYENFIKLASVFQKVTDIEVLVRINDFYLVFKYMYIHTYIFKGPKCAVFSMAAQETYVNNYSYIFSYIFITLCR